MQEQEVRGNVCGRVVSGGGSWAVPLSSSRGRCFFLFCWENGLSSNTDSNRISVWNSGNHQQPQNATQRYGVGLWPWTLLRPQPSPMLIEKVETGGFEQLDNAEKVVLWQRFETFRNRLPADRPPSDRRC